MNILKKVFREVGAANKSVYGATDTGQQRDSNQDCYLVLPQAGICAVADGMGGHKAGEVASLSTVKTINKYFTPKCVSEMKAGKHIKDKLTYATLIAHERIMQISGMKAECAGMGSTVAISFIHQNVLHTCHVGDSRVYVINPSGITQITRDHSTVGEMVRLGEMTREEARHSSLKNEVTQALGVSLPNGPEYNRTHKLDAGTLVLLCSDGLWDMLSDKEIQEIVMKGSSTKETCNELIQRANAAGGEDNITVVLTQVNGDGEQ